MCYYVTPTPFPNEAVMSIPETRASLILRLSDTSDVAAWDEFVAIYEPLVYRLAVKKGFQDADARELVQEVMLAVSRAVDRFDPAASPARFRDWLFTIARNLMINFMTRHRHKRWGTGNSNMLELLHQHPAPQTEESQFFDLEFRREIFHRAAEQVEREVQPRTWRAFWLSSVDDIPIPDVADQLGMSIGAVYIARSRVIGRIRTQAEIFSPTSERSNG